MFRFFGPARARRLASRALSLAMALLLSLSFAGSAAAVEPVAVSISVGGAVGWEGFACTLMSDTTVRCWGGNTFGELGGRACERHLSLLRPPRGHDGPLLGAE